MRRSVFLWKVGMNRRDTVAELVVLGVLGLPSWAHPASRVTGQNRLPQSLQDSHISIGDHGAKGDGSTDDTAALVLAEAAAFTAGKSLYLPEGIYRHGGVWQVRVSIHGYGATIRQVATGLITSANHATVRYNSARDVSVLGLSINGNATRGGLAFEGCINARVIDVSTTNTVAFGIALYLQTAAKLERCSARAIRYNKTAVPSAGGSADGFYHGGCEGITYSDCLAEDFRRIGFVSESANGVKSARIRYSRCSARNGNNSDDSSTEYNAGFWVENTNGVEFTDCTATAMAGNAGQTRGRVVGMTVAALGSSMDAIHTVTRCRVHGGAGRLPAGISLGTGTETYLSVQIRDCQVGKAAIGIESLGGYHSVDIQKIHFDDVVYGVLVNAAGGVIGNLKIDDIDAANTSFSIDTGIVHIYSAIANCAYTLSNVRGGFPHVMRAAVAQLHVRDCALAWGGKNYSTFVAAQLTIERCDLAYDGRASNTRLFNAAAAGIGASCSIRDSKIVSGSSVYINPDGKNFSTHCSNVLFERVQWVYSTTGVSVNRFDNCQWNNIATNGAIWTNTVNPTRQELQVHNCKFSSPAVSNTPLKKHSFDPTVVVLRGNTYNTARLHDFTASQITESDNVRVF